MQVEDRISAIEKRAAALNLSLWRVSKLAGIDYCNISRWRKSETSPTLRLFEQSMSRLETTLSELERTMLATLSARVAESERLSR